MKLLRKNIPDGMRDRIFGELVAMQELGDRLIALYKGHGYGEVVTPAVEYYDVFHFENQIIPEEAMFKTTDRNGKLVVMRPDNTTPITRIVTTRLKGAPRPLKLCYRQNVFRSSADFSGKRSEFTQTGIEIFGGDALYADIECACAAMDSLKEIENYFDGRLKIKLELGHVGYYRALMDGLGLSEELEEQIRRSVEAKNFSAIRLVDPAGDGSHERAEQIIRTLPGLFGGVEVFERARRLAGDNQKAAMALDDLKRRYDVLTKAGFGDDITIDLAIVHKLEYYTGFVFRGYLEGAGEPVLGGGRYDLLPALFDGDEPATGFGINLSLIADTAARLDAPDARHIPPECIVVYEMGQLNAARQYQKDCPWACELSCCPNLSDTLRYASLSGIPRVVRIRPDGGFEILREE